MLRWCHQDMTLDVFLSWFITFSTAMPLHTWIRLHLIGSGVKCLRVFCSVHIHVHTRASFSLFVCVHKIMHCVCIASGTIYSPLWTLQNTTQPTHVPSPILSVLQLRDNNSMIDFLKIHSRDLHELCGIEAGCSIHASRWGCSVEMYLYRSICECFDGV
jgi:hypothetical protein